LENRAYLLQLLEKYRDNRCSPQEVKQLLAYFRKDSREQELLMELVLAQLEEQPTTDELDSDRLDSIIDDAYFHIQQQLHSPTQQARRIKPFKKWLPYAAAAVIACISISIYFATKGPAPDASQHVVEVTDDILPGTNKATITLSDGSQYELIESQQGITVNEKGIMYTDGSLVADLDNIATAIVTVPRAGTYQVTLPDGTKVILNSASSLHYPTRFAGTERRVQLEGEAYFEVTHNEKQPFVVQSKGQQVQVLGTAFNINAYENEPLVATTLVTGSVRIIHGTDDRKSALLKPGQQAVLRNDRLILREVDAADYVAWKDGLIVLSQADLPTIVRRLERWYDVEFDPSGLPGGQSLNGELPTDTRLSGILDVLELNTGVKFKIQGRRIVIDK